MYNPIEPLDSTTSIIYMEIYKALVLLLMGALRHYACKTFIISIILVVVGFMATPTGHYLEFIIIITMTFLLVSQAYEWMDVLWLRPNRYSRIAKDQGIEGPKPSLLWGNTLDMKRMRDKVAMDDELLMGLDPTNTSYCKPMNLSHNHMLQRILPEHVVWSQAYGVKRNYLMWIGPDPHVVTTDMEVVKDTLLMLSSTTMLKSDNVNAKNTNKYKYKYNKSNKYKDNNFFSPSAMGKSPMLQRFLEPLTGLTGLILANGDTWAHQRKVVAPAFHSLRLKGSSQVMVGLTMAMVEEWCQGIERHNGEFEIDIEKSMVALTADVIAHTQFGSSYERGRKVFRYLEELKEFVFKHGHLLTIPGMSYVPLPIFTKLRSLKRVVETSIREIVEDRKAIARAQIGANNMSSSYGVDLLGLMLSEGENFSVQQIVDECKTFFFAGHETTALLLTWALLLLAHNTHWQEKARLEVVDLCEAKLPDFDSASKMKTVEMILYETLRLFSPANSVIRVALCDLKLGDLFVPRGMSVLIPIVAIHLDPELWGETVYDFNPARFSSGISKAAKHPMAFLPFAHGPRNCIGQAFALMEAKLVLATILLKFSFIPSPSYKHAPELMVTIRPKFGAPIIVKKLV